MNASTYALALFQATNLRRCQRGSEPFHAWLTCTDVPVQASGFAELRRRLGALIYQHDVSSGVIPYNTGLIEHGMVDLLTLGSSVDHARSIERAALRRLGSTQVIRALSAQA
jgi:hypothetical protein